MTTKDPTGMLIAALQEVGLPVPTREYRFSARRFRFDLAYPEQKIAIEIEGQGPWGLGRHQRPGGFERDLEKYNLATSLGWRVFRFTPRMIRRDPWGCVDFVKSLFKEGSK